MPKEEGFLSLLMESEAVPQVHDTIGNTFSLYADDMAFARAAFDEIKESDAGFMYPDFHPDRPSLTLAAPDDLRRRCQFIPREAIPERWEFLLTTDRNRVQQAIADARRLAKQDEPVWPEYHLLWELHPVTQWLLDKVMCRFLRHEAPVIVAPKLGPGHAAYLFQGILSNKRSQPVIVDWFAVPQADEGFKKPITLDELVCLTGLAQGLANSGQPSKLSQALQDGLTDAVGGATAHMKRLRRERTLSAQKRLDEDNRRFDLWRKNSLSKIKQYEDSRRMASGRVPRDIAERCERQRRYVEN